MFVGTFNHNIDDKKRLIIPSKFRNELGNDAVMTVGHDNSINVYTQKGWQEVEQQLLALNSNNPAARKHIRIIAGSACSFTLDSQGRAILPANLIKHSGIVKEVVLVGVIDHIEIWSQEKWDTYYGEAADDFDSNSESLI